MNNKKNLIIAISILAIILIILIGIKICMVKKDDKTDDLDNNIVDEIIEESTIEDKVDEEIKNMSLRDKIGQMLVVTFNEDYYSDTLDDILSNVKPSGVILFNYNVNTYDSTVELIKKIKDTSNIPMLIAIDQEGGRVQKIKDISDVNVTDIPDMYTLGKTGDSSLSRDVGKVVGEELAAFGVNTDFAPVLDIFSNSNNTVIGNRAFGSDAQTVIDMALPFAKGLKEKGVIPTYKHFPGHGDTDTDSHVELPVVTKTKEELYENELLPFKVAVEEDAEMIMVAHIALPNVTGSYIPASLSGEVINGILREELSFDGVVITDAVNMKALTDNYTVEEICNYSINAGVDIILMPVDPVETVDTIEKLVNDGVITEERINESVKRILLMKHNNGLYEDKELNKENIGTQEHKDIINKI